MQIPVDLMEKWKSLRSYGDNKRIVEKNEGIIEMDITRAFSNGVCSDIVFVAMAGFYKEREEIVRPYMS